MNIELLDSRRLTGPNLFWQRPGAILDVAVDASQAEKLVATWSNQAAMLMEAVGWPPELIRSRVFDGGVSLVIGAPIDVLYAACEVNEAAFERALADLGQHPPGDLQETVTRLVGLIAAERKPALLAMQSAAAAHHVPFLWDDEHVSVGYGKTSVCWPAGEVPQPDSVDWNDVHAVPLGIVTGTNGKSTTVRIAAEILAAAGLQAGITSTDYIRVGGEILDRGDYSGPGGARTLLRHPRVDAVVLEVARGGLLRRGIGVERADAALITNIAVDHMGEYGINSVEEMAEAKFIVRRALSAGAPLILNADDPQSVRMSASVRQTIAWFGLDAGQPLLRRHLAAKGLVAFPADGWLVLADGRGIRNIVRIEEIPVTFGGAARYNVRNALGAMLLCSVLGAPDEALASGLRTFSGDAGVNPGRGNLFVKDGVRIFVDFAHNEHGMQAIADTVRSFGARRNYLLMGQAGDRSDSEIAAFLDAACELDPAVLMICDLPGYERGREGGAVAKLIERLALDKGLPRDSVKMFKSPADGAAYALRSAREGDCLVLLALTQRERILEMVRAYIEG
jgi:cyanophycin synthetase